MVDRYKAVHLGHYPFGMEILPRLREEEAEEMTECQKCHRLKEDCRCMTDGKKALGVEEFITKWFYDYPKHLSAGLIPIDEREMKADLEEMLKEAGDMALSDKPWFKKGWQGLR
jgi:hypothetical protein